MGFWFFMLATVLLIPLLMAGFGALLYKSPPKAVNHAFGYRTKRSMKNVDTWLFAQRCCGRLWQRWSWPMLAVSAAAMLPFQRAEEDTVGLLTVLLLSLQMLSLISTIFLVERKLKNSFDEDGNRR